jgi:hypothetical protein
MPLDNPLGQPFIGGPAAAAAAAVAAWFAPCMLVNACINALAWPLFQPMSCKSWCGVIGVESLVWRHWCGVIGVA